MEIMIDYCRSCGGAYDTRKADGKLRVHGPKTKRCVGSGQFGSNGWAFEQERLARPPKGLLKNLAFLGGGR